MLMSAERGYGVDFSLEITCPSSSSSSDFKSQSPIGIEPSVNSAHIYIMRWEADLPFIVACKDITDSRDEHVTKQRAKRRGINISR